MKHLCYIFLFNLAFNFNALSQDINIGQKAEDVNKLVEFQISNYYRASGYHQVRMTSSVNRDRYGISEVIFCKENVPMIDLGKPVDLCIHYIMTKNRLSKILTEYSNISLKELESAMSKAYVKVGNYYFDINQEQEYYKIFLSKTGQVIKEYKNMLISPVPAATLKLLEDRIRIKKQQSLAEKRKIQLNEEQETKDIQYVERYNPSKVLLPDPYDAMRGGNKLYLSKYTMEQIFDYYKLNTTTQAIYNDAISVYSNKNVNNRILITVKKKGEYNLIKFTVDD